LTDSARGGARALVLLSNASATRCHSSIRRCTDGNALLETEDASDFGQISACLERVTLQFLLHFVQPFAHSGQAGVHRFVRGFVGVQDPAKLGNLGAQHGDVGGIGIDAFQVAIESIEQSLRGHMIDRGRYGGGLRTHGSLQSV
jgi:hypothetical protein